MGGGCSQKIEHVMSQSIRTILRHVSLVVGVGAGRAGLDQGTVVCICAGHV